MAYFNSAGYWLGLQKTTFTLMGQVSGEGASQRLAQLGAWAQIFGEYALRVLAIRQEFYRNSVKDPVSARLKQSLYEEATYVPANEFLDERTRELETLQQTQLMKALAALTASNTVKRSGGGGGGASK